MLRWKSRGWPQLGQHNLDTGVASAGAVSNCPSVFGINVLELFVQRKQAFAAAGCEEAKVTHLDKVPRKILESALIGSKKSWRAGSQVWINLFWDCLGIDFHSSFLSNKDW